MKEVVLLLALLLFNFFDAFGDGLRDDGRKTFSKAFEMLMITALYLPVLVVTGKPAWYEIGMFVGSFILIRYAIFDYTYNGVRGLGAYFIGKTSLTDRFWRWFFNKTGFPKTHWFSWTRIIALILGAGLIGVWELI